MSDSPAKRSKMESTSAFGQLQQHYDSVGRSLRTRALFQQDPHRFHAFRSATPRRSRQWIRSLLSSQRVLSVV